MNHDAEEESMSIAFYSIEGAFDENPESIAFKLTLDGVE
jgi:hypothetical protein